MNTNNKPTAFSIFSTSLIDSYSNIHDPRVTQKGVVANNIVYSIQDVVLSAFSVFFFQHSSLLKFQRSLENMHNTSTLRNLFGVNKIPKDTQIRDVIDKIPNDDIRMDLRGLSGILNRFKILQKYKVFGDKYLILLDGVNYYSSNKCRKKIN